MPRNSSGTYTLPLPPVVPNTLIEADYENTTSDDIATALTESLDRAGRGGMSGPLRLVDGVLTAPGLSFNGETNSGMWRESTGVVNFSILTEKVFTWSAGGVSVPAGKALAAEKITVSNRLLVGGATEGLTFPGRGYIAVNGTSDSVVQLQANGVAQGYLYGQGDDAGLTVVAAGNRRLDFTTDDVMRLRIKGDGVMEYHGSTFNPGASASASLGTVALPWMNLSLYSLVNDARGSVYAASDLGLAGQEATYLNFRAARSEPDTYGFRQYSRVDSTGAGYPIFSYRWATSQYAGWNGDVLTVDGQTGQCNFINQLNVQGPLAVNNVINGVYRVTSGNNTLFRSATLAGAGSIDTGIAIANGMGGGLIMVTGADAAGVAFAALYLLAVRVAGGGGDDIVQTLINRQGSAAPSAITFSNSGGRILMSVGGGGENLATCLPIGGFTG